MSQKEGTEYAVMVPPQQQGKVPVISEKKVLIGAT